MVPPYRDFAFPLNVFMHVLTREGGTVDSLHLHYGLFTSDDGPLAVAQERSTTLLLERLPGPPARVLEVGIGLGTLLQRLTAMGYEAEGMTPDAQQFAMVRARYGDRIKASCGRFEDVEAPPANGQFDVILFQESSQYIDSDALFRKAGAISSRVLVLDEFALASREDPAGDSGHVLRSRANFLVAAADAGFEVVEEIDLSREAAPTVDFFLARLPDHREAIATDLGLSHAQIDELIASGRRYREQYRSGTYGYRLFDLRKQPAPERRAPPYLPSPRSWEGGEGAWGGEGLADSPGRALPADALIVDPFLQVHDGRLDHPLTGRTQARGDGGYEALSRMSPGGRADARIAPAVRDALARDGWLVPSHPDLARRFRLRIVTIETHSACNQECYFCPVSVAPRDAVRLPDARFDDIVDQLTAFRDTIEGVFLSGYNEPTLDPQFVDRCVRLMSAGLPVAVNTNATGLTPARVDQLAAAGTLRFLSVNLSTLDRSRYTHDRGRDHLEVVLRHLDYAKSRPVATEMVIAVLGTGDAAHQEDFAAMQARFAGSRFDVRCHEVMDRAGRLPVGLAPPPLPALPAPQSLPQTATPPRLRGCDNLGSRPLQHLHITADGRCVFCCEDYDERYVVGDLRTTSILDVLQGDELARLRRWSYGLDEAPDDFICRRCIFALRS
jgi:pyruvate-formate lyase-activating enzyme